MISAMARARISSRAMLQQQRRRMGSDMPVPQSQNAPLWLGHKVENEGWEGAWYFYCTAGLLMQAAVIFGAPETSIESWARPEAKARLYLASQGQTEFEFGKHYQDVLKEAKMEVWTKYADRAVIPGDDDDDDDDDDDEEEVRDSQSRIMEASVLPDR
jgi:hypothetical protein